MTYESKWNKPLQQDWPDESSVRVVAPEASAEPVWEGSNELTNPGFESTDQNPWGPARQDAAKVRVDILNKASRHINAAVAHLAEAADWYAIVDPSDRAELLRSVQTFADTIAYRLANAEEWSKS